MKKRHVSEENGKDIVRHIVCHGRGGCGCDPFLSDAAVRAFAAWRTVGTYQAVAELQGRGVP